MHQFAMLLARLLPPAFGILLGLLGFTTLGENLLGWTLFVAGVLYAAGAVITTYVARRDVLPQEIRAGDGSFWLLMAGLAAVFLLSPLEFLYMRSGGLPVPWFEFAGVGLACLGAVVLLWARHGWAASYARRLFSTQDRPGRQAGLYRFARHPGYLGYLLAALGLALGYGSAAGAAALVFVLVPAMLWRIQVEDRLMSARFGTPFLEYAAKTKRLIPGIW